MKTIIVALLLCSSMVFAQSEKYYVTFVKGTVTLKRTGKIVKVGDALTAADQLNFKDKTAKVSCISPGKGRFDISSQQLKPAPSGELLAVLKSSLIPSANTYHLSTRSLSAGGNDPEQYFKADEAKGKVALFEGEPLPVSNNYKLDAENFFFIQYDLNGKTTTKKVNDNGKALLFDNDLFKNTSGSIMLCYQSGGQSKKIATFTPILVKRNELKNEVAVISKNLGSTDAKKITDEVTAHIFDNYGKMGKGEISSLLK